MIEATIIAGAILIGAVIVAGKIHESSENAGIERCLNRIAQQLEALSDDLVVGRSRRPYWRTQVLSSSRLFFNSGTNVNGIPGNRKTDAPPPEPEIVATVPPKETAE